MKKKFFALLGLFTMLLNAFVLFAGWFFLLLQTRFFRLMAKMIPDADVRLAILFCLFFGMSLGTTAALVMFVRKRHCQSDCCMPKAEEKKTTKNRIFTIAVFVFLFVFLAMDVYVTTRKAPSRFFLNAEKKIKAEIKDLGKLLKQPELTPEMYSGKSECPFSSQDIDFEQKIDKNALPLSIIGPTLHGEKGISQLLENNSGIYLVWRYPAGSGEYASLPYAMVMPSSDNSRQDIMIFAIDPFDGKLILTQSFFNGKPFAEILLRCLATESENT